MVRIDLLPRSQRTLQHALKEGHLRELEAAFRSGDIEDYYLVPAGHMAAGACQVRYANRPLDRRRFYRHFVALEALAGVEHVPQRGLHGLRRAFASLIAAQTMNEDARDVAQGWALGSGTRARIYTEEAEPLRAEAAEARAAALDAVSQPADPAERAEELADRAQTLLREFADLAPSLGDDLGDLNDLVKGLARAGDVAQTASAGAGQLASEEPPMTREEEAAQRHEETAEAIREEMKTRGLTGKRTAELTGVSPSDVSAVVRGKSRGIVSTTKLKRMLDALRTEPGAGA